MKISAFFSNYIYFAELEKSVCKIEQSQSHGFYIKDKVQFNVTFMTKTFKDQMIRKNK